MKTLALLAPVDLEATRALTIGLNARRWRVVLGCARALSRSTGQGADLATSGLLVRLHHPYAEVREEAAKSLAALSQLVEVPLEPLGEAFLGEEEMAPFLALGRTILNVLRSGCPAPVSWADPFQAALSQIRDRKLTELPLGELTTQRSQTPITVETPSPGLMSRLLSRPQTPTPDHTDPPPRPGRPETRRFLTDLGDRLDDVPEVLSLVCGIFSYIPTNAKARLALILDLCQMPFATFETSESLVLLAANQVRDERDKTAFFSSMWGWDRSYDPTWTARIALSAAQARPDLRLQLFESLWARQSRIDWNGWANSLRQASPFELDSVVAAALAAPESDLEGWMKLLSLAPVEHIVPALAHALGSSEKPVAYDALERLLLWGQPVPWLLNDISHLREQWSEDPDMLRGLDTLMRKAIALDAPLPEGMRQPDQMLEWTLEDSAANPFLSNTAKDWRENLQLLNACYIPEEGLHLITATRVVSLRLDDIKPNAVVLPDDTVGSGITILAVGHQGELLLAGRGRSQTFVYRLPAGASAFQQFEPSLPAENLPNRGELLTDGTNYGWAKVIESPGQNTTDLSLRKEVSYFVDLQTSRLESSWREGLRPMEKRSIETSDSALPPLTFQFSACGGYRINDIQSLAIRTGSENPIYSQGHVDGAVALHLEVFPSRLCRVYLWKRS